ncbi:MAG: DUF169 domain-containing protein [Dehalococcoidales bacterium]|nr:DUF169 domain-containing protein [Dehalococcoidales bacterium]
MNLKDKFLTLWKKYFNNAEIPIAYYYTDKPVDADIVKPGSGPRCIIGALAGVRQGKSLAFDVDAVGCPGGKRYLGFSPDLMPDFEYFLSCGTDEMEGERYKTTPEMVSEAMKEWPVFEAPAKYIVFKRWDNLEAADNPDVVIFFAEPDVLSGLFTLSSFDETGSDMSITPFGSGCSTIVQYPYLESKKDKPKTVLGMFDVSARPFVPASTLTFSVPISKFARMVNNMEESFLITPSWSQVQKRIR